MPSLAETREGRVTIHVKAAMHQIFGWFAFVKVVVGFSGVARHSLRAQPSEARLVAHAQAGPLDAVGDFLEQLAAPPNEASLPKESLGVVITGGANGVGYAYAAEFLRRGHRVMICALKSTVMPV